MQSVATIVAELQKAGTNIFREGDSIRFRAHAEPVCSSAMEALSLRRTEVMQYLRARDGLAIAPIGRGNRTLIPSPLQAMWWNWIDAETSLTLFLMEFTKEKDSGLVIRALQAVVAKHPTLRSCFSERQGVLTVHVHAVEDFQIELETCPPSFSQGALKARMDEFVARPLVASAQWLLRAKLFSVAGHGHAIVLVANHLVVDGTSIDILRADLRRYLRGVAPVSDEHLPTYADFAQWQWDFLARSGDAVSDYWRTWAFNQSELRSPAGKAPMHWSPGRKVRRTFTIPSFAYAALEAIARNHSTYPYFVYLALLALSVARWSGQSSFAIRSICDGRVRPELASLVGLMTEADAISVEVDSQASFSKTVKDVEKEYHAASRLRLPNIYAFPPFAVRPGLEGSGQRHNVPIVMNYRKAAHHTAEGPSGRGNAAWPPPEGTPRHDHWRHDVSPVCLELTQVGGMTTAAFLLHDDILSAPEQDGLIRAFFEVFEEKILRASEAPGG